MKRGLARFWYRFKNWFRTKPGPGEPLQFLCGSEEELRRVTTWFCHVPPHMFDNGVRVLVEYPVTIETVAGCGGLEGVVDDKNIIHNLSHFEYECGLKWCACIFKFNTYEGTEWSEASYLFTIRNNKTQREWKLPIPGSCVERPLRICIEVYSPSAHERAEALLALSEWLDGKVTEEEKRELLQLPDDAEI